MPCMARLTSWAETCSEGKVLSSHVRLCKNTVRTDEVLCDECLARPWTGSGTQSRMIHGTLLEEPPPDSRIYGSAAYWRAVAKHGPPDPEWLAAAVAAQEAAEQRCAEVGAEGWRAQRPCARDMAEMRIKKEVVKPSQVVETKGTLLATFSPIKVVYQESAKAPVKMQTDTIGIWKEAGPDGKEVWRTECGLVFACDCTGQPGELLEQAK